MSNDLHARLASVGIEPCGDNSCIFGRRGGMGTNGGCRCIDRAHDEHRLDRMIRAMAKVLRDLATLSARPAAEIERLVDAYASAVEAEHEMTLGVKLLGAPWNQEAVEVASTARTALLAAISARLPAPTVAAAPAREPCTGVSASWCHNCGDCTCERDEHTMEWGDPDPACPLHRRESEHGSDDPESPFYVAPVSLPAPTVPGELRATLIDLADDLLDVPIGGPASPTVARIRAVAARLREAAANLPAKES